MDKSEFANLHEEFWELKWKEKKLRETYGYEPDADQVPAIKANKQQIQLTKDRIQEMVDSR